MKKIILAAIALTVLGAVAADARPHHRHCYIHHHHRVCR